MAYEYFNVDGWSTEDREVALRWGDEKAAKVVNLVAEKIATIMVHGEEVPVYDELIDSTDINYAGVGADDPNDEEYYIMFHGADFNYAVPRFLYYTYCHNNGMTLLPEHGNMWLCGHLVRCMTDSEYDHWNIDDDYCVVDQWHNYVIF